MGRLLVIAVMAAAIVYELLFGNRSLIVVVICSGVIYHVITGPGASISAEARIPTRDLREKVAR